MTAVFCNDAAGRLCVLANQRGTATDKEVGKWNLPVGFLDFNETCAECAVREVHEETGVVLDPKTVKLFNINSKPDDGSQDVGFRYYVNLSGTIDEYPLSTENMEKNEVIKAKWIPIAGLDKYIWAWNHLEIIRKIYQQRH